MESNDKTLRKAKSKSKRTKKKKGTKLKSKLKVKVAPTRKGRKTKIAVSRGKKKEITLPFHSMSDMQFQIFTSVVYFISQRLINKVDFKQKVRLFLRIKMSTNTYHCLSSLSFNVIYFLISLEYFEVGQICIC